MLQLPVESGSQQILRFFNNGETCHKLQENHRRNEHRSCFPLLRGLVRGISGVFT